MKTSVEYLLDQMFNHGCLKKEQGVMYISPELVAEAKEMEKQQLNDAYNADRPNLTCYEENTAFKEYYNETFNNED
jgi:hypothetical protein